VLIALLSLVVMALASSGTSATSNVLYAAYGGSASASDLYTVDPATGAKASVGAIGFAVTGLAVQPGSGTLFGVTSGGGDASTRKLITINKTTGAGTVVGSLDNIVADIAFDSSGQLWGWSECDLDCDNEDFFVSINTSTGAASRVGSWDSSTAGDGMSFDKNGVLYAMLFGSGSDLSTIDTGTGVVTPVVEMSGAPVSAPMGSASFGCDGTTFYATNGNKSSGVWLVTVNTSSGAVSSIGQMSPTSSTPIDALAWDCAGVVTATQVNRLGYCTVSGNTNPNTGAAIAPGTFVNLAAGQPASDSHYKGALAANYFQGKGITCDASSGYTATTQTVGYGGAGTTGPYPYFTKS